MDRKLIDQNSLYIGRKIKLLSLANYNDIGNVSNADVQYYYKKDENSGTDTKSTEFNSGIVKSGIISTPNLESNYTKNNNDWAASIMASFKIGEFIKIKSLIGYNSNQVQNNVSGFSETIVSPSDKWILNTDEINNSQINGFIKKITLIHDRQKNRLGSYEVSIINQNEHDFYYNKSQMSIAYLDTLKENLNNNGSGLFFVGNETFKLRKNKILSTTLTISKQNIFQTFDLNTNRFVQYFMLDSSFSIFNQKLSERFNKEEIVVKLSGKVNRTRYNYGITFSGDQNNYSNNILIENNKNNNYITKPTNKADIEILNMSTFGVINSPISPKNTLSIGGIAGYSSLNFIRSDTTFNNNFPVYTSFVEYQYKFSDFNFLQIQSQIKGTIPQEQIFYPNGLISGNASILNSTSSIKRTESKGVTISYLSNNIYQNIMLSISCSHYVSSNTFVTNSYLTPSYSQLSFIPTNNNEQSLFSINTEKYFSRIKSKFFVK